MTGVDLLAELTAGAAADGAHAGRWPGLTFYRFSAPTEPRWHGSTTLSVGVVYGERRSRLVIGNHPHHTCRSFDASPDRPCLSFALEVDPHLVIKLSAGMAWPDTAGDSRDECVVADLDDILLNSIVRFLRSLTDTSDRRVLAPLYLQEMLYRVLERDRSARLPQMAARQLTTPIAAVLDHIDTHLADPLTVTELARQVSLSPSAFSRLFRQVTGSSPYQYVKEKRLSRARELLERGRLGVAEVSRRVGYTSLSHFIKEFRCRFGATPGEYAGVHSTSMRNRRISGATSSRALSSRK